MTEEAEPDAFWIGPLGLDGLGEKVEALALEQMNEAFRAFRDDGRWRLDFDLERADGSAYFSWRDESWRRPETGYWDGSFPIEFGFQAQHLSAAVRDALRSGHPMWDSPHEARIAVIAMLGQFQAALTESLRLLDLPADSPELTGLAEVAPEGLPHPTTPPKESAP